MSDLPEVTQPVHGEAEVCALSDSRLRRPSLLGGESGDREAEGTQGSLNGHALG